jgi:hypothetical protein
MEFDDGDSIEPKRAHPLDEVLRVVITAPWSTGRCQDVLLMNHPAAEVVEDLRRGFASIDIFAAGLGEGIEAWIH